MALTKVRGGGVDNPLTLGGGSASDRSIIFDGNAQDFHIGLDDSADKLTIGLGSTLGTTAHMTFDSTGTILKPLQPCFFAKKNSDTANVGPVNSAVAIVFDSEIFDQNADFDTSNGTFTAPITGRYFLSASLYATQLPNDANYCLMEIVASNRNHMEIFRTQAGDATWEYHTFSVSTLMDMDAGDTAKVNFYQPNGTQSVDITGNSTHSHTSFSGFLAC